MKVLKRMVEMGQEDIIIQAGGSLVRKAGH